jgi:hypothetical protein
VKTTLRDVFLFTFPGLLLIVLTACGGGSSSPAPMTTPTPMTTSTYTIGGTVTGLPSGLVLVLQNNAGDDLAVCTDCAFTFKAALAPAQPFLLEASRTSSRYYVSRFMDELITLRTPKIIHPKNFE